MQLPLGPDSLAAQALLRTVSPGSDLASWLPYLGGALARRDPPELDDAYLREAWVGACVDIHSGIAGGVRARVYDGDPDDGAPEVTSGPIYELLRKPMGGVDATLFQMVMAQHIDLAGECVLFLRGADGKPVISFGPGMDALIETPVEMIPVRGDSVGLDLDQATGYPIAWRVGSGGGNKTYPAAAVVNVFETVDPARAPWRGIGPVAKAWGYAAQNYMARRYQTHLMANNGSAGGIITIEALAMPDPEVKRAAEAEFDEKWNQPANAGKTRLLWSPVGAKSAYAANTMPPKDLEYGNVLKVNKEDIAAILRTPGALLGQHQENYATFKGHMRMFNALRLRPYLTMVATAFNTRLIARLRDGVLARQRIRFDTEQLDREYADVVEQGTHAKTLIEIGLPRGQALQQAGIKADPFEGDDVAMVAQGSEPLDVAITRAKASAAIVLQDAGIEGQAALEEVGLGHLTFIEPPEPVLPAAPGAPGGAAAAPPPGEAPAGEAPPKAALEAEVRAAAPTSLARAAKSDHFANRANRTEEWLRLERLQVHDRRRVRDAVRKVLVAMRRAQLRALRAYAETGSTAGARALFHLGEPRAVYAGPQPYMPPAALRGLLAAIEDEDGGGLELAPVYVHDCCGDVEGEMHDVVSPALAAWSRRYPGLARHGLKRAHDVALLTRATITEHEIDQILVAQDQKWSAALAEKLQPILLAAFQTAADDIAQQLGVAVIDFTAPDVLRKIAARAIQVAEGSTSVVAQRLRAAIIDILKDHTDLPTLQEAVQQTLSDLSATTANVFNASAARALTIARTEVGIATESARYDSLDALWRAGTIAGLRWLTSGQPPEPLGTTRLWHFTMDGQTSIPGVGFVDGLGNVLRFPLDPNAPPETVVNCRCHIVAVPIEAPAP